MDLVDAVVEVFQQESARVRVAGKRTRLLRRTLVEVEVVDDLTECAAHTNARKFADAALTACGVASACGCTASGAVVQRKCTPIAFVRCIRATPLSLTVPLQQLFTLSRCTSRGVADRIATARQLQQ